jgi:hypothetical protein
MNRWDAAVSDNLHWNGHPGQAVKGGAEDLMSSEDMPHGCRENLGVQISLDQDGALGAIRQAVVNLL